MVEFCKYVVLTSTSIKQHEWHENQQLRNENQKASCKQYMVHRSINNMTCSNDRGPIAIGEMSFNEQHFRIKMLG